jgi:hypothetical protein
MASIDDYIRTIFFITFSADGHSATAYVRRSEIETEIRDRTASAVAGIISEFSMDYSPLANRLFDELLAIGVIDKIDDDFAGTYYQLRNDVWQVRRSTGLSSDNIYKKSKAIGAGFFPAALSNYANLHAPSDFSEQLGIMAPASDRVVTLSHNQITELDEPLSTFIQELEHDNGIPDAPGIKERILGQIRAGRELILAGSFKAHLLYMTLLSGLAELIKRYDGHVIGATAATLVELLIKHYSDAE